MSPPSEAAQLRLPNLYSGVEEDDHLDASGAGQQGARWPGGWTGGSNRDSQHFQVLECREAEPLVAREGKLKFTSRMKVVPGHVSWILFRY